MICCPFCRESIVRTGNNGWLSCRCGLLAYRKDDEATTWCLEILDDKVSHILVLKGSERSNGGQLTLVYSGEDGHYARTVRDCFPSAVDAVGLPFIVRSRDTVWAEASDLILSSQVLSS